MVLNFNHSVNITSKFERAFPFNGLASDFVLKTELYF